MFDYDFSPYRQPRNSVVAQRGMVATAQPLAAQAGLDMLKKGGNAVDAAIATAACLTVVEPTSNGIGSDAFALIWTKGKLHGLNASGVAPQSISIEAIRARGYDKMPVHGLEPVIVPGAPAAWAECSRRFGRLPLSEVLKPAVEYAENGFPVSPVVARNWQHAFKGYTKTFKDPMFESWFNTFAPDGKAPAAGELWSSPAHARSLKAIADSNAEDFYKGELADRIDRFSRQHGGFLRKSDLENYRPQWVDPISINYHGYDIWELPPNGQGLVALLGLNILKQFDLGGKNYIDTYHKQIEALKLAFSDGKAYITDPRDMGEEVAALLSENYAAARARLIGSTALDPAPGTLPKGGTVYLATADSDGTMVSFIQSNFMGFGSGIVIPDTGISMQNRGHTFSLNPKDANALAPGKKTYHTIIPGFLTRDGQPLGPFGVMGGYMQPQGHLQVVSHLIDDHLHPQAALDAPRWQWIEGKTVWVESDFPNAAAQALSRRGHDIRVALETGSFGRGQIILRDPETGVLSGGSESRADGFIAAW
ncbi:gamma-glutamyltransferase family protein [Sporolactobacillus laevolacticus]|uniref:gamma-glutamyltransferase family protein n=1 Tax=Sporolactobacillus laevolacticus TaxID=33018 RepID=UPI0025B3A4D6|nr:gamma-glutamyltransferase family protein [Sporolactobacillus laevolacticus]MDN3955281.1 gamma-glutamyltransferase family protein [Sporolactobacillus laevolacticus]